MLFTACRDGVSQHPDENVPDAAMSSGTLALERFLMQFQLADCAAA
jgi:allantoate deiminase